MLSEAYITLKERREEYDNYLKSQRNSKSSCHHQEEFSTEVPRWERSETDLDAAEELLKLAIVLIQRYNEEQNRRRDLGKRFVECVRCDEYDDLVSLYKQKAFMDELSGEGYASIHYAILKKNKPLLELLLDNMGANVNVKTKNGKTALHIAVQIKNFDLCGLLLERRAKTHLQDQDGNTALHIAIVKGKLRLIDLLVGKFVWFDIKNNFGKTAKDLLYDLKADTDSRLSRRVLIFLDRIATKMELQENTQDSSEGFFVEKAILIKETFLSNFYVNLS